MMMFSKEVDWVVEWGLMLLVAEIEVEDFLTINEDVVVEPGNVEEPAMGSGTKNVAFALPYDNLCSQRGGGNLIKKRMFFFAFFSSSFLSILFWF